MERLHIDWSLHDPELTLTGVRQCKQLALDLQDKFTFPKEETLIVVSPLIRTLQSFEYSLGWLQNQGVPVELRAEWQESTGNPCDIGTEPDKIKDNWPKLDFSRLDKLYPAKTGLYDPSEESLLKRARFVREWLYSRPEKRIIVVTHSGFLRRVAPKGDPKYANAEYRVYNFAEENEDTTREFQLVELERVHQSLETQQNVLK